MSDAIPTIEPMGIRPQFKRIKPYLKSYVRGFDDEQYQDKIANLQRYAREGEGFQYEVAYSRPLKFDFCTAYFELVGAYWTEQWFAVQGALGETDENWQLRRQRSVAYGYWAYRIEQQNQVNVIAFHAARNPGAPRETGRMSLMAWGINVANCLVLGWQDWALDLAQLALWGIDNNAFLDAGKSYHRRIQFFILRLIADWQGWPVRNWPKWATDEPLYNALITHWRTPNPDDLTPLLLAACDRHTHECRYSSGAASYDVEKGGVGTIHSKFLSC